MLYLVIGCPRYCNFLVLNCLTISLPVLLLAYVSQISRPVEASQALVSSSRLTIPSLQTAVGVVGRHPRCGPLSALGHHIHSQRTP